MAARISSLRTGSIARASSPVRASKLISWPAWPMCSISSSSVRRCSTRWYAAMKELAWRVGSCTPPADNSSKASSAIRLTGTRAAMLRRHRAAVELRVNPATKRARLASTFGGT